MSNVVVADTGPLIALSLLDLLPLLAKLFDTVHVPEGVFSEATQDMSKPGAGAILQAMEDRLLISHPVDLSGAFEGLVEILDRGEAEALALAEQLNAIVLLDEKRGRKVARKHGIPVTGTAALLIKAKRRGDIEAVKPLLETLTQVGYRLSPSLVKEVLKIAGE